VHALAASWGWHAGGRDAAFTFTDLAAASGVEPETAQHFLDAFSVTFGARDDSELWKGDPARALGGEMEVMRRRPIVHDGHGLYLPSAIDSVFYGLRDRFTEALMADAKAQKRYQRHRAHMLEERAVAALSSALKADWSHGSVKFWLADDEGEEREGEADGIVRADSLVVLVETKAGALAPGARRTAPERLERGLRDLIEAAAK
jgi:hypothetical protein